MCPYYFAGSPYFLEQGDCDFSDVATTNPGLLQIGLWRFAKRCQMSGSFGRVEVHLV